MVATKATGNGQIEQVVEEVKRLLNMINKKLIYFEYALEVLYDSVS